MLELDFTLVVFAISFLIFMFLLNMVFFSPVAKAIEARDSVLDGDQAKTDELLQTIEDKVADYEAKLKSARQEASQLIANAIEESKKDKQSKITALSEELNKKRETAVGEINKEKESLVGSLSATVREITNLMVSKILGQELDLGLSDEKIKSAFVGGASNNGSKVGVGV